MTYGHNECQGALLSVFKQLLAPANMVSKWLHTWFSNLGGQKKLSGLCRSYTVVSRDMDELYLEAVSKIPNKRS
jgi:hypothetical protein